MKRALPALLATLAACAVYAAPPDAPEVDRSEIDRRGDLVVHVAPGIQAAAEIDAIAAAMAPPADDSNKWFISLIESDNCAACARLKRDLAADRSLQGFVNLTDPKTSWAHFNTYKAGDQTQRWFLDQVKTNSYPTLVIQPPRNGQYGDAKTVVAQKVGYDGNARQLAAWLRDSIAAYVKKTQPRQPIRQADTPRQVATTGWGQSAGINPPFVCPSPQPPVVTPGVPTPSPFGPPGPNPYEFPPAGPQPATIEELRAAFPAATNDFIVGQLMAKATIQQAATAWQIQQANARPAAPAQPAQPADPATKAASLQELRAALPDCPPALLWSFHRDRRTVPEAVDAYNAVTAATGGTATPNFFQTTPGLVTIIGGLLGAGLLWYRNQRLANNKPTLLTDEQFTKVQAFLANVLALFGNKQTTNPNDKPAQS